MSGEQIDLDALGRYVADTYAVDDPLGDDLNALIDMARRVEALEAERDALDKQVWRMRALRTDDSAERTLALVEARADRAEARLARVTDDSMTERIARAIDPNAWWQETAEYPTMARDEWEAAQDWALDQASKALAVIRAAADEQEADQ